MNKRIAHYLHKIPSFSFFAYFSRRINKTNLGMIIALHSVTKAAACYTGSLNHFIEIREDKLEKMIRDLKKLGADFVSLAELENKLQEKWTNRRPLVHISFDDGYQDNYTIAYPILKKYGIPFSVFVVSDFINNRQPFLWWYMIAYIIRYRVVISLDKYAFEINAAMYDQFEEQVLFMKLRNFLIDYIDSDRQYLEQQLRAYSAACTDMPLMLQWEQLNRMIASGLCEVGVHTKTHARFKALSAEEMKIEIAECRDEIEKNTGQKSCWFAYSYGDTSDLGDTSNVAGLMEETGMRLALSTICGELKVNSNKYLLPRIFLNNATTLYTLKTRLNGTYQRNRTNA